MAWNVASRAAWPLLPVLYSATLAAAASWEHAVNVSATVSEILACERRIAAGCGGINAFEEPDAACEGLATAAADGAPPRALALWPDTAAADLGCVSRSLRFGRLLWCLAASAAVTSVLELFTGTGCGSTLLLAHGLASGAGTLGGATGGVAKSLYSVERDMGNVVHAASLLKEVGVEVRAVSVESGLVPRAALEVASAPGAWLLQGTLLPHGGLLESLCGAVGNIDLLMLDPPTGFDLRRAWSVLEQACNPRFIAIHNANLEFHAGWIRPFLLSRPNSPWREVARGSHPSYWEDGRRAWTLLARESL